MATMREHLQALMAAKAVGDTEAVDYIRGQMRATQKERDAAAYSPVGSTPQNLAAGAGRGIANIGRNVGNMVGLVSDQSMADAAARDAPLMGTTAGKVGSFVGETAVLTPLTMGVGGLAAKAGGTAARVIASPLGRGMVEGAAQGAITAGPNDRLQGAALGGVAGAVLPAVGAGYKIARSGVSPTANARRLMAEGVTLTPGQMNPAGALNQLEEVAQAVPYVGRIVSGARAKGYEQFQHVVAQDAAPAGVAIKPGAVSEMVDQLQTAYRNAYDFAKGFPTRPRIMQTAGGDIPLSQAFIGISKSGRFLAKDDERKVVGKFLANELTQLRNRSVKSDDLLAMRSNIRTAAREADSNGVRKMFKAAADKVTEALDSQLPPEVTASLRATDAQYGKYKILENAVTRAKDQTGSFTPSQFSMAVRDATNEAQYAAGGGRGRDLSRAAVDVFQARQPLTGRQVLTAGPLVAAAAANPVGVGIPLAAGIGGLYGTATGRALAAGNALPQMAARSVERKVRRAVSKDARELIGATSRNALVNYLND